MSDREVRSEFGFGRAAAGPYAAAAAAAVVFAGIQQRRGMPTRPALKTASLFATLAAASWCELHFVFYATKE